MAADAGGKAVLHDVQEMQLYLDLVQGRHYSSAEALLMYSAGMTADTGSTAVLQEVQEVQLYNRRCRRYRCTWILYRNDGIHVYSSNKRILQE